jgi:hypothetical protein
LIERRAARIAELEAADGAAEEDLAEQPHAAIVGLQAGRQRGKEGRKTAQATAVASGLGTAAQRGGGELRLADAAETGGGGRLADGCGAGLQRRGEVPQFFGAADKQRGVQQRHVRAGGQRRRRRHVIQRHRRKARPGRGEFVRRNRCRLAQPL